MRLSQTLHLFILASLSIRSLVTLLANTISSFCSSFFFFARMKRFFKRFSFFLFLSPTLIATDEILLLSKQWQIRWFAV